MSKKTIIGIILAVLVIAGLIYFFLIRKDKPENLTDEELRQILLNGNKISGADIESMNRSQLLASVKSGGYKLT